MTDVGRARRVATDAHMVHSCNTIVAAAAVDANVADRCLVFVRLWRLASDGDRRRPVSVVRILSINNMIPFELAGRHLVKARDCVRLVVFARRRIPVQPKPWSWISELLLAYLNWPFAVPRIDSRQRRSAKGRHRRSPPQRSSAPH